MSLRSRAGVLIGLLSLFPALVLAQNTTTNTTAASTFYLDKTETQFSVNIANDSEDVFIYFTSPAYSWVGVGFGEKMEGSLMLIMYPNADGDNVTLSPRIGRKASEPTFNSSVAIDMLPDTQIDDTGMLMLNARCRNCREFLDTKATVQPMIFAFGNGQNLRSDSPSANLKRHVRYGHFTMDMLAATGTGGVPAKSSAMNGVVMGGMTRDHDRANLAHAVIGCLALFVLWPLNVIFAGFFKNIKTHVVLSMIIMVFLIVSYALGGVTSMEYNRSKAFNTPHQIVAFITLLPILLLSILPLPSLTSRLPNLASKLRPLHTPLVSSTFILLILAGGMGLHLSGQSRPIILVYTAVSLGAFVFVFVLQSCIRKRGSAHARAQRPRRGEEESDRIVMLGKMEESRSASAASLGTPPPYGYGSGGSGEFGGHGQQQQHQRSPSRSAYGGGTMPGPQYLLNMHPGVPVQVSRM